MITGANFNTSINQEQRAFSLEVEEVTPEPSNQQAEKQPFTFPTSTKNTGIIGLSTLSDSTSKLRSEEVGYFDPEYQGESISQNINSAVVNAGKHVYYRDVYIFVDRLKDLGAQYGNTTVFNLIVACFRGSALMWYSMDLEDV